MGIALLLPLGDRVSNRRLVPLFVAAQTLALLTMAFAADYRVFVAASTALGFFTITPYLLPAYVSRRVAGERLGHATAILTTGVIAGVLLSRTGSGAIAEYFGWRTVYLIAGGLMCLASVALPLLMEDDPPPTQGQTPYLRLLALLWGLARAHPAVLVSGAIQSLSFGIFLCVWLGIGLHLTRPEAGYGTDAVGLLSAFAVLNLFTTPRLGRWADRIGAHRARLAVAVVQLSGVLLPFLVDGQYWWLLAPITLMNVAGPLIDVTGRMTSLSGAPELRTRLMTLYIVIMFSGAGVLSWAGTAAYAWQGWYGTCSLALALSLIVVALAARELRR